LPNSKTVSYIRYIEVLAYGRIFRLDKKNKNGHVFLVDGRQRNIPYKGPNNVRAIVIGGEFVLTTDFGLTVLWDGDQRVQVLLCSAYSNHVCGLCGNADGNPKNDYVDRQNRIVRLTGHKYTKYFNWGSKWRVFDETTNDSV
jgi:hypothetical protein